MTNLMEIKGFIIIVRKPGDDKLYGPVEHSWNLGFEEGHTFFYWTSESQKIDGSEWARRDMIYLKQKHPEWLFDIYDAREDDRLPVELNWSLWLDAQTPSNKTFSGVKNKYWARNLQFKRKGHGSHFITSAPDQKMIIKTLTVEDLV